MARRVNVIKNFDGILKLIPEDRKQIAESLVKELSFMAATLEKLRADIEKNGVVGEDQHGNPKESPALKSYNTTIQRYSLVYKQLNDMIPKQDKPAGELLEFIGQG